MKFETKYFVAMLAFTAMGAVRADVLVIKQGGATFHGLSTLTFSADALSGLTNSHIDVANDGAATLAIERDAEGAYSKVASSAPLQTLTLDFDNAKQLGMSTQDGLTLTVPAMSSGSGGSLTVSDIAADLRTQTISATILGGNGVGKINNFALWTFAEPTAPIDFPGYFGEYVSDISGLTLTAGGLNTFSQALGISNADKAAFQGIDFGALHIVFNATLECCGPPAMPAIPEPSSFALTGLGLAVLGMAAARRQAV